MAQPQSEPDRRRYLAHHELESECILIIVFIIIIVIIILIVTIIVVIIVVVVIITIVIIITIFIIGGRCCSARDFADWCLSTMSACFWQSVIGSSVALFHWGLLLAHHAGVDHQAGVYASTGKTCTTQSLIGESLIDWRVWWCSPDIRDSAESVFYCLF